MKARIELGQWSVDLEVAEIDLQLDDDAFIERYAFPAFRLLLLKADAERERRQLEKAIKRSGLSSQNAEELRKIVIRTR